MVRSRTPSLPMALRKWRLPRSRYNIISPLRMSRYQLDLNIHPRRRNLFYCMSRTRTQEHSLQVKCPVSPLHGLQRHSHLLKLQRKSQALLSPLQRTTRRCRYRRVRNWEDQHPILPTPVHSILYLFVQRHCHPEATSIAYQTALAIMEAVSFQETLDILSMGATIEQVNLHAIGSLSANL